MTFQPHPSVTLDATNTRRRERATQSIAAMRHALDALTLYITNADAETLKGDWWADTVQDAENAVKRALYSTTHDGQSRMGWHDGKA